MRTIILLAAATGAFALTACENKVYDKQAEVSRTADKVEQLPAESTTAVLPPETAPIAEATPAMPSDPATK